MGSRPEELRAEIDMTREELAYDVDRLADRTVPTRVAGRKWEGAKTRVRSVTDRVMGARDQAKDKAASAGGTVQDTASRAGDKAQEAASRVGEKAQDAAHSVADTVRQTPDTVVRQTQGNPLAVGLIAFGIGLLTASLLPETEAEKRAETAKKDAREIAPAR